MQKERIVRMLAGWAASPAIIFFVALGIRIVVLLHLLPAQADTGFYRHNEAARIAWAVVSGYGFSSPWPNTPLAPTAQQPPVYPLLLAGIFKIAGAYSIFSLWIAVILNAIFSSLTAVLLFLLGKRVFGIYVGILAGWVWACWLQSAVVSIRLWESSLSAFLLTATLWLMLYLRESDLLSRWLLFGLLLGLGALTNTTLLPVEMLFLLWLWMVGKYEGKARTKHTLAALAACIFVLLPWTVRNYHVFHRVVPIRDNFGMELWIGNHEGVTYLYDFATSFPLRDPTEYNQLGEINFMMTKQKIATQFIYYHPKQFVRLCAQRLFYFWTSPYLVTWLCLSVMAWFGAGFALYRRKNLALPFTVILLVCPVVYYVTHPWSTYRHPIEPVMILLVANLIVSPASEWIEHRFNYRPE